MNNPPSIPHQSVKLQPNSEELPQVTLYVDGAAIPNPGAGGIGIVLLYEGHRREISQPIGRCSNNAAELQAAITGLMALKWRCAVTIISDSQYLIETMNGNYSRKTNLELWRDLDFAALKHECSWRWVRGHVGDVENERANTLANNAAIKGDAI